MPLAPTGRAGEPVEAREISDPSRLLRHPPFALLSSSRVLATVGFQMLGVAVGWQLYALTGRALDLGLVGLAQFAPMRRWYVRYMTASIT